MAVPDKPYSSHDPSPLISQVTETVTSAYWSVLGAASSLLGAGVYDEDKVKRDASELGPVVSAKLISEVCAATDGPSDLTDPFLLLCTRPVARLRVMR